MDFLSSTLRTLVLGAVVASAACVPDVDTDDSLVSGPTVLAVQVEPAEAAEGRPVAYRALFVNQNGQSAGGTLSWFHCSARKPSAELGPVSQECFDSKGDKLASIGRGLTVTGSVPRTACSLFGPKPPILEGTDGPPGRPADPDGTGGYKQPVVLGVRADDGSTSTVVYEQRVQCGLAGVSAQLSREYNDRYRNNVNPQVTSLEVERGSGEKLSIVDGTVLEVSPGETVKLAAVWPACPEVPVCGDGICSVHELRTTCPDDCQSAQIGCGGQEEYVWLNVLTGELDLRRESMSVAWYKTGGEYVDERTGIAEDERADRSTNEWTAPQKAGPVTLWTVVRDARGGVGFRELKVRVR